MASESIIEYGSLFKACTAEQVYDVNRKYQKKTWNRQMTYMPGKGLMFFISTQLLELRQAI